MAVTSSQSDKLVVSEESLLLELSSNPPVRYPVFFGFRVEEDVSTWQLITGIEEEKM